MSSSTFNNFFIHVDEPIISSSNGCNSNNNTPESNHFISPPIENNVVDLIDQTNLWMDIKSIIENDDVYLKTSSVEVNPPDTVNGQPLQLTSSSPVGQPDAIIKPAVASRAITVLQQRLLP